MSCIPIKRWAPKIKADSNSFGGCWTYKSGLRIFVRASEVPFFYGHFWQKCPSLRAQKWHFGCPDENSETTFISPTSPKNDGIAFDFKRLRLLGWVTSPFLNIVIFCPILGPFPISTEPNTKQWCNRSNIEIYV